jgi:DNA-binding MarR family transcriptional regulator
MVWKCNDGRAATFGRARRSPKAKGRLRGKQPKLSKKQEAHLVSVHRAGTHTTVELAELFAVARSTVYRAIKRAGDAA